jgi:antitoxin VapB
MYTLESIMTTLSTRVFMNGNSQAVRIPQEFRLNAQRVEITRTSQGDLLIHPLSVDRGSALLEALSTLDDEYADLLAEDRQNQPPMQEREGL